MSIQEKVTINIKQAMRDKDKFRLNVLKYIKSLLQNNSLSSKPIPELDVVQSHHKKMSKTLGVYQGEALLSLNKELDIIAEFIPKAMSEADIVKIIDKHASLGNMGAVMKAVKEEIQGPFDGKLVSSLVKAKLA